MTLHIDGKYWGTGLATRIVAVVVVAAAVLLTIVIASGQVLPIDGDILLALRHAPDLRQPVGPHWLLNAFENFTSLGSSAVTGLVLAMAVAVAIAARDYRHGLYMLLTFAGAQLLSNGIKVLIARPRPEVVPHLVEAGGFSFPSGHSTLSAASYLGLGLVIASCQFAGSKRVFALVAAAIPIALVGLSRMFLRALSN
jgi:undecaprenyl-diphosphatase